MELERIEKLVAAGYTKAEIDAMSAPQEPTPEPAPEPAPEGKQEPTEANPVDASLKALTEIVNGLSETVKEMQAQNIKNANAGKPSAGDAIKATIDSFIDTL